MKINYFFLILIAITSCKSKDVKMEVICDYSTNLDNDKDIALLVKQRLNLIDSIEFNVLVENKICRIDIYSKTDTSILSKALKNQLKDGYYFIHRNKNVFENLIKINDSLNVAKKTNLINEIREKRKESTNSLVDSMAIIEIEEKVFAPLFILMRPKVEVSTVAPYDCKSIGYIKIKDFVQVCDILSQSSYFSSKIVFMVSSISHSNDRFRDLYAIDSTRYSSDINLYKDNAFDMVKVFNNKIEEDPEEIAKFDNFPNYDLSSKDSDKYLSLMDNNKHLIITKIRINAR